MTGGVQEAHPDRSDLDDIIVFVGHERGHRGAGHLPHPGNLVLLNVDGDVSQLEQVDQALDVLPENLPTDVVGVVMGRQYPRQAKPAALKPGEQSGHVVGRVDQQHLAGGGIADDIDVVTHRGGELVARRELLAGEQLAEEYPLGHPAHRRGAGP